MKNVRCYLIEYAFYIPIVLLIITHPDNFKNYITILLIGLVCYSSYKYLIHPIETDITDVMANIFLFVLTITIIHNWPFSNYILIIYCLIVALLLKKSIITRLASTFWAHIVFIIIFGGFIGYIKNNTPTTGGYTDERDVFGIIVYLRGLPLYVDRIRNENEMEYRREIQRDLPEQYQYILRRLKLENKENVECTNDFYDINKYITYIHKDMLLTAQQLDTLELVLNDIISKDCDW